MSDESKQRVVDAVKNVSPDFVAEITERWNKEQALDYYEGMWAAIRVMQSFPEINPVHQGYLSEFSAGCMIILAEKIKGVVDPV